MKNFYRKIHHPSLVILLAGMSLFGPLSEVRSQDLPGPSSNLQTLPVGSFIIPMDNIFQISGTGLFNLKSYGLIIHLLNNDIKVKWVIKAGKAKDGIDFSATTELRMPVINSTPTLRDFKGGPFVIFQQDTTGVTALVNAFNSANALAGNSRPKLQRTLLPVLVDVRYDLTGFKPKAGILTDGSNEAIHLTFMANASVPAINYGLTSGVDLISGCYTFASEPHNGNVGPEVDAAINSIRDFVEWGGNFLAQCEAVKNYENNVLGRFQTTTGISTLNASIGTTVNFANPDLSYSQIHGAFNGSAGGSLRNWSVNASGINDYHTHATGTLANSVAVAASASKLKGGTGGMVYYLGNHDYNTANEASLNGNRLYMNALLTPALRPCLFILLNTDITSFNAATKNNVTELNWAVSENQNADYFEVEKSTDGRNFSAIGRVPRSSLQGFASYHFTEAKNINSRSYYRIAVYSTNSGRKLSKIITLNGAGGSDSPAKINLLGNPVTNILAFNFSATGKEGSTLNIYNSNGRKVYSTKIESDNGTDVYKVPSDQFTEKGLYLLEVVNTRERTIVKFIKQ